jgi:hypothetical protein
MAGHQHEDGASAQLDIHTGGSRGIMAYIPYFLFVVIIYVVVRISFGEDMARKDFHLFGSYNITWVEVILLVSTAIALIEQMKVSHPGIDNTWEALTMFGMAVVQIVLFVLGAASVVGFKIFSTTEFLMLTVISVAAAVIAILINARTLRRTIGVGDN